MTFRNRIIFPLLFVCCASGGVPKSFETGELLTAGEFKSNLSFSIADWNKDGKKDIVLLYGTGKFPFVHLNIGTNSAPAFGLAEFIENVLDETRVGYPQLMQVTDLNNDSLQDMLFYQNQTGASTGDIIWFENTGSRSNYYYEYGGGTPFGKPDPRPISSKMKHPFAADWDRDGKKDIILNNPNYRYASGKWYSYSLDWYPNIGTVDSPVLGTRHVFRTTNGDTLISAPKPFVADWNNDGYKDIIACGGIEAFSSGDYKVRVWQGTSNPDSLSAATILENVRGGVQLNVADWNEDGKKDLVILDTLAYFRVYLNTGSDALPAFGAVPDTVKAADFNHSFVLSPGMVDWNRDGRNDLFMAGSYFQTCGGQPARIRFYLNSSDNGVPKFDQGMFFKCKGLDIRTYWGYDGKTDGAIGDINGDGHWDLFLASNNFGNNYTNDLWLYTGDSATYRTYDFALETKMNVGTTQHMSPPRGYCHPRAIDFDMDGLLDLLYGIDDHCTSACPVSNSRIFLYLNRGTRTAPVFSDSNVQLVLNSGQRNASFDIVDFNGDGLRDIVLASDTGTFRVYLNHGSNSTPLYNSYSMLLDRNNVILKTPDYRYQTRLNGWWKRGFMNNMRLADWDGDGTLDLLCAAEYTLSWGQYFVPWVFKGVGEGTILETKKTSALSKSGITPNPFNPAARITINNDVKGTVRVAVYDIRGALVKLLHDGMLPKGKGIFSWNGTNHLSKDVPAGLYLVKIRTNTKTEQLKAFLIR